MKKNSRFSKIDTKEVEFTYEEIEKILLDHLGFQYWSGFKVMGIDCDVPIDFIKITLERQETGGSVE